MLLSLVFFVLIVVVVKCYDLIQRPIEFAHKRKEKSHVFLVFFSLLHFLLKDTRQEKKRERAKTRRHNRAQNYSSKRAAAIAVSLFSSKSTLTVCAQRERERERERDIREREKERAKNLFFFERNVFFSFARKKKSHLTSHLISSLLERLRE